MVPETEETLCSLVMPIFHPKFDHFNEAIRSLVSQTYRNIEIIIVSDGHSNEIDELLKTINDPRIKLTLNEKRLGFQRSLNQGLELATGQIIGRMDSDDVSMPQRIEKQMAVFQKDEDVYLVGSYTTMIGESSSMVQGYRSYPSTDVEIRTGLLAYNPFAHSAVTFRREVMKDIGVYDESIYAEDYQYWMRILEKHKGYNIPEYLVKIRNTSSSMKITKIKKLELDVLTMKVKMIERRIYPTTPSTIIGLFVSTLSFLIPSGIVWNVFNRLIQMGYFEQSKSRIM